MHIPSEITKRGGLAATYELLATGVTERALTAAVRSGAIVRVRQGWYGLPTKDAASIEAVRVGGRLTCVSGARLHGLWVSESPTLHLRVSSNTARLRSRHDKDRRLSLGDAVHIHWRNEVGLGTRFALSPRDCLRDMIWCQSPERVVAAVDSALRAGQITAAQWRRDIERLPRRLRRLLERIDRRSESIIESITRFRLEQLGFELQLQVKISGVGRVDILVGKKLVIELDGWEFHNTRDAFEEDRRRDAELARHGYLVLRFTYRQVTRQWAMVLGAIRRYAVIAASLPA